MRKLGLIAGGGGLPVALARHCQETGRPVFVIRLEGLADGALDPFEGGTIGLTDLPRGLAALRAAACEAVCFAGLVRRPPADAAGLPGDWAAAGGDGRLLGVVIARFEAEGFSVEGAHEVMGALALSAGARGRRRPADADLADMDEALRVARALGALDVGQGAVCRGGLILAVEAQEGTDAMLRRVAALTSPGAAGRGVLAKVCKPGQDLRIDMPTLGPTTVRLAAAAGLAGIVGEAGQVLVVDAALTIALADDLGLFLFGAAAGAP